MHELPLISTIAAAFTAAWVLGLLTQWLRLSPIVGYLLAGVAIGPHTPGIQGDPDIAQQLAEVGVILLMFGVGLHFHLEDLAAVKWVAGPGALVQTAAVAAVCVAVLAPFGVPALSGGVIGIAVAVGSTVVMMRVLMDADVLNSPAGHAAVGWSLVQDVVTVVVLVLIPVLGTPPAGTAPPADPVVAVGVALAKLAALVVVVAVAGSRVVPWALTKVARLRSRELFTLTIMVFSVALAAGSYYLFGVSMALGAFLAGMMVALSPVSHQAAADALPLRDAFAVLFFVSVGMLFDPTFLWREPLLMVVVMAVILVVKPLLTVLLIVVLGHSVRTALVVAIGLAHVGEFSFILSDSARRVGLITDRGHNLLVGGAILSITVNPLLFRAIPAVERWLKGRPRLWTRLSARAERRVRGANAAVAAADAGRRRAVVVGYGPVGRTVDRLLRDAGLDTVVIDLNMDTVDEIRREGRTAVYGDAAQAAILESAGVGRASHLVLTLPQASTRAAIVATGRSLNARLKILVRAHYLRERGELEHVGATAAIFEEAEAAVALARLVLVDAGHRRESIEKTVRDIRARLILENVNGLRAQPVRSIMVPWTRVRRLSDAAGADEVRKQVRENRFSRWPVVAAATGLPVGYLLAKDLIGLPADGTAWTTLVRPLAAVRPDDDVESTLQYFQREGATVCVVRDGDSPVGIVTIEDVLEQVVGRFEDEYPRHAKLVLRDLLVTSEALLEVKATTAEGAIAELAAVLPGGAAVADLAIERERDLPTNLGLGVAVPHARCPGLRAPVVVFGRSASGVAFGGPEGAAVHLLFLLVTPAEQPNLQVVLLGSVARVAGDAALRDRLRAARTPAEVADVLAAATA